MVESRVLLEVLQAQVHKQCLVFVQAQKQLDDWEALASVASVSVQNSSFLDEKGFFLSIARIEWPEREAVSKNQVANCQADGRDGSDKLGLCQLGDNLAS